METIKFSDKLISRLRNSYSVAVLTGAGVSAPSGVPTFRGKDGLWNKFNPEELANFESFQKNPELVWEWYNWRRKLIKEVKPNLGHYALVDLENLIRDFTIITQNVDNLHQHAGSKNVVELHGNIMRNKCSDCGKPYSENDIDERHIPRCSNCNGMIRPDVVWFGELLPEANIMRSQQVASETEIFMTIGTSSTVEPAASLSYLAKGNGAYLVEINPEKTPLTHFADESYQMGADVCLPYLIAAFEK
jgi:NAD-dependent deacetylase